MRDHVGVLALVAGLAAACAPTPEPHLLRRHASLQVHDTVGLVDVAVFSAPAPGEGRAPRLDALSRSAQSELIRSVAEKTGTLTDFLGALSPGLGPGVGETAVLDRTRHRRRLVVSAERLVLTPGARLQRLRIALGIDPGQGRFLAWDHFSTRHRTVEVGEARLRRTAEGRLELDVDPRGTLREVGPGVLRAGRSAVLDEELQLRDRALSTGILRADSLVLLQEGATGVDVSGNSLVTLEVDLVDAPARTVQVPGALVDGAGTPLPPDSVRLRPLRLLHAPRSAGGLRARLSVAAEMRAMAPGDGGATLSEGDDRVRLLRSHERRGAVTLVPESALRASVWEITDQDCRRVLHRWHPGTGRPQVLHFPAASDAHRFRDWLAATRSTRVGARRLYLGPEAPLEAESAAALRVRLLPLNWDPGPGLRCP